MKTDHIHLEAKNHTRSIITQKVKPQGRAGEGAAAINSTRWEECHVR